MSKTIEFYNADLNSTLFPLKMNQIMIQNSEKEISDYIYQKILVESFEGDNFLPQQKVYSTKPKGHLRRTVKLDPIAEYFIYDITYRNRSGFRSEVSKQRMSYGYRFKDGVHIPVHVAYKEYKEEILKCSQSYSHSIRFDIASYFNSLYHHDISHWFSSLPGVNEVDQLAMGKFMRQINAGRSVDFMPHGIYPCKMIGNEFLKFVDLSAVLKSTQFIRFMDDFTLFDNNEAVLRQDFIKIQQILGQYALNINPTKTFVDKKFGDVQKTLTDIQKNLIEIVSHGIDIPVESGVELAEVRIEIERKLDSEQIHSILSLLKDESLEESDADLILGFLRLHSDGLIEHLPLLLKKFPNLIKHIYSVCSGISDKIELVKVIINFLGESGEILEYQLFWIGCMIEDFLLGHGEYGAALIKIYELTADYKIARSKILEIPDQGFGLKEIRNDYLKTGQSDWLAWASAMGSRTLRTGERNYTLDYFSKGSPLNFLVASAIKKIESK